MTELILIRHGDAIDILDWADTEHLAGMPTQPVCDQTRLARRRTGR